MARALETVGQGGGDEPACLMRRCAPATGHAEGWWAKSCPLCPADPDAQGPECQAMSWRELLPRGALAVTRCGGAVLRADWRRGPWGASTVIQTRVVMGGGVGVGAVSSCSGTGPAWPNPSLWHGLDEVLKSHVAAQPILWDYRGLGASWGP